jgi:hypothetical protein
MAVSVLFNGCKQNFLAKALTSLGLCSTMMWFIHAIPLSTATREIFQSLPLWINDSVYLFVMITGISYLIALGYNHLFVKR